MRKVGFWAGIILSVGLFSCQKELTGTDQPEPTQGNKLLSKVIYSEPGSLFIDSFEYDPQGRVTRFVQVYYDSSTGPNPAPYIYFYGFHYNGNETLPYKITDTSEGRGMLWLIEYDGQKRKTVDSIVYSGSSEKFVSRYAYTASRIIANSVYSSSTAPGTVVKDTFDYDGSNCTRHAVTIQQGVTEVTWQYSMTYDNRINPLSKMNIARAVFFGATGTLGDFEGLNANNYLNMTYTSPFSPIPGTTNFLYVYDADGYPVSQSYSDPTDPSLKGEAKYVYR